MPNELRGFYKVGGASLVASGTLFLVNAVLDLQAGQPPLGGAETLAWAVSRTRIFEIESEVLFFAAMLLVPAVVAIYVETADIAQFVVAVYYGGMHSINECRAIATVI
jgi:hypothetical protein